MFPVAWPNVSWKQAVHWISGYNAWRKFCGLTEYATFDGMTDIPVAIREKFKTLYEYVPLQIWEKFFFLMKSNFWLKSPSYFEVPPLTFKNSKISLLKFTSLDMLMTWISSLLVYQKHTCLVLWLDQLLAVLLERTFRDLCMGTDSGLKLQTQNLVSLKVSHFNTTMHKKKIIIGSTVLECTNLN